MNQLELQERLIAVLNAELKQYRDIEDEIGNNLIVLLNALRNGFYYKTRRYSQRENKCIDVIVKVKVPVLKLNYEDHSRLVLSTTYQKQYIEFEPKDCGKTWALTKEGLICYSGN